MHELAICQSLIDQVEVIAVERNAQCVTTIVVAIGPLSGVEKPAAGSDGYRGAEHY